MRNSLQKNLRPDKSLVAQEVDLPNPLMKLILILRRPHIPVISEQFENSDYLNHIAKFPPLMPRPQ